MNSELTTKQYVSRGGLKLIRAIENWKLEIGNYVVLDVGSSTGGFVDCLLQSGAARVYSVDTAYGELAWKLRQDPRVVVMERTNILHLASLPVIASEAKQSSSEIATSSGFIGTPRNDEEVKVDLITIDASWTKLELILPVVQKFLKPGGQIIALLKPHYQADKKLLIKGILPREYLEQIKNDVFLKIENSLKIAKSLSETNGKNCKPSPELAEGLKIIGNIPSPILGGGGNQEYLLLISN